MSSKEVVIVFVFVVFAVVSFVIAVAIAVFGITARGKDLGTDAPAEGDGLLPVFVFPGEDFAEGVGHGFDVVLVCVFNTLQKSRRCLALDANNGKFLPVQY